MKYQSPSSPLSFVFILILALLPLSVATAGVYSSDVEVTYKEYWVSHTEFTGGCGADELPPGAYFIQPSATCTKILNFDIPDDFSNAIKAEIYLDLVANRTTPSARFTLNGNATLYAPDVGARWSRTPYVGPVTLGELNQGSNSIEFTSPGATYNVHDIGIRIYYDQANPLVAGPGSDVTPPDGALTSVGGLDPAVGGTLDVDSNSMSLTATASDDQSVPYVEFHAYYYGYDEDNDREFVDWHNIKRMLLNPGATGTIDHVGTVTAAPYNAVWELPHVVNQSGVRFKLRIVDAAGNVREAPGGVSEVFTLSRTNLVESYLMPGFQDAAVFGPADLVTRNIVLPDDLSDVTAAYLVSAYWQNPDLGSSGPYLAVNGNAAFPAFDTPAEDVLALSIRPVASQVTAGTNQIDYTYSGTGEGELIEEPGPMLVLVRSRSPAPATGFLSDAFNAASLNKGIWSFVDLVGDGVQAMTGTQLEISVPAGVRHDLWLNKNEAPRVLQPAADTDFEVEVKMDSPLVMDTQFHGIIVQEDVNEFIRFDFFTADGATIRMFAATFVDGQPVTRTDQAIAPAGTAPLYMRVRRQGDTWTQSYSQDGTTYTSAASFDHPMMVRDVGLYAGNAGGLPAYTASFDYFNLTSIDIVTEPADQAVGAGQTATFTVMASGRDLTYQWQEDSGAGFGDIAGGTGASYMTPATMPADDGKRYRVVITNPVGIATSAEATLTVLVPPAITSEPTDQSVVAGTTATFSVVATGTEPLGFQWQKDSGTGFVDIAGATTASYTTPATALADDGTRYRVVVTNAADSVTSAAVILSVTSTPVAPSITTQPADQSVTEGQTATFSVVATGTGPLTYQWQKNGGAGFADIAGATNASYTTPAIAVTEDGALYRVVVGNAEGSVTSTAATLNVSTVESSSSGGGGGCAVNTAAQADLVMPMLMLVSLLALWLRPPGTNRGGFRGVLAGTKSRRCSWPPSESGGS